MRKLIIVSIILMTLMSLGGTATAAKDVISVTVGTQTGILTYGTVGTATYSISVLYTGSSNDYPSVILSVSKLPTGVTCTFSALTTSENPRTSTLTLTTANSAGAVISNEFKVEAKNSSSNKKDDYGYLTINRAQATITVTNLIQTYTGANNTNKKYITVTTNPSGLHTDINYHSADTQHIGSYTVDVKLKDDNEGLDEDNYEATPVTVTLQVVCPEGQVPDGKKCKPTELVDLHIINDGLCTGITVYNEQQLADIPEGYVLGKCEIRDSAKPTVSLEYKGQNLFSVMNPIVTVGNKLTILWNQMFEYVNINLLTNQESVVIEENVQSQEKDEVGYRGSYEWTIKANENFPDDLNKIEVTSTNGEDIRTATSGEFYIVPPTVTITCPEGFELENGICKKENQGFAGYTFGTSDCNRMAILLAQVPSPRIWYTLEVISWEYKYSIGQMLAYCHRCGANMTPVTDGYFEWNPAD